MRSTLPTCFLIGLTVIACGRRDRERGLGAGADSAGLRDTTALRPAPAPATDPSTDSAVKARTSRITGDSARSQTQSGVTDKSGRSKLGSGVRKTRPDANEPVTAKGDTLSKSPGSITDSLNRRVLEQMQGRHDTMPKPDSVPADTAQPLPSDTAKPLPTDTTRPSPTDSTRPTPRDTLLPTPPDSTPADTLRPLPGDTTRPRRDSTPR
jgi:hypothetical protein